ncbi:MAG: WD40 repeat domain-containing protein [Sedimentisphaerales bacterium]|nr:WD40 repeat domain-containing protein [Sedimentisphaerales bacterium]
MKVVIRICLISLLFLWPSGCRDTKNTPKPTGISALLPCGEQSWEDGAWEPLKMESSDDIRTWDAINAGDGTYWSVCKKCDSSRILDFKTKKEIVIASSKPNAKVCNHEWIAGFGRESSDLIEAGSIIAIQQKRCLFVFMIQEISGFTLPAPEITYKFEKFCLDDRWPIKIDLSKIEWKGPKTKNALPIVGREIETHLVEPKSPDNKSGLIEIMYDQYYGGANGPGAVVGDDAAKIAIIHKDDLKENVLVDFRQYRFKSWEDGLGNLCGEEGIFKSASVRDLYQDSGQKSTFLDSHNGPVRDIAVSPNGDYIASIGDDQRVVITDIHRKLKIVIGPLDFEYGFSALAINQEGNSVLAAASPDPRGVILKIDPLNGNYEKMKDIPFLGAIQSFCLYNNDRNIAYISVMNEISFFDLESHTLTTTHRIFGGFMYSIAISPRKDLFAITSANMVNLHNAEPCKLTVFDQQGLRNMSYKFESCTDVYYGKLTFLSGDCLALCLPKGEMWQWIWLPNDKKWNLQKKFKIPQGNYSAIESSPDGRIIWLARDKSVLAIDASSGKQLSEEKFDIGEIKSDFLVYPINVIKFIPNKQILAVGFGDGRIALMPLSSKQKTEEILSH